MVYDLVGITPIPSGTQFLVNWESPQTGVKDYGQWYQRCNFVFIGILPSHNLGTTTKLIKTNLTSTMIDYCLK